MTSRAAPEQLKHHRLDDVDAEAETATCRKCGPVSIILIKGFWRCEARAPQRVRHRLHDVDWTNKTGRCALCGPTALVRKHGNWACKSMAQDVQADHLYERYGITVEEYDALFEKQEGLCRICRKDVGRLHVDHDHETNEVRGLLCGNCNRGLGLFSDNAEVLREAARYLEER